MMKMRKSRVSLALSAALAGGAIVAVPQQAAAQNVADAGIGQVLIFPYYSINDGWQSLFNVTNTSDLAIAVKVRFHEAQNSRDVLDFNVLLSPKDAWTGYVQRDAEGRPKLKTVDNSCTSPIIPEAGLELSNLAYTGPYDDGGIQEEERLWEGYVEMIAMGQCATTDSCFLPPPVTGTASDAGIGWLTEHVQGTPRDCATADSFFIAGTGAVGEDLSVVPGTGEPIANADSADSAGRGYVALLPDTEPLKGNLSIVQLAQGFGAGTEALAISGWAGTNNLVTAQQFPWFLEPTIATGENVWDTTGLPDIELLFNAESVINEWSANPNLGVKTDLSLIHI